MPYVATTGTPAAPARARSLGARAAPPTRTASWEASASAPPGWSSSRTSWVGTRLVYRRAPGVNRVVAATNAAGVNPPATSMTTGSVPASSERSSTCRPATWCAGRGSSHWPGPPSRSCVAAALARSAPVVSMACFGEPVEPEVPTTTARSSGIPGRARGRDGGRR